VYGIIDEKPEHLAKLRQKTLNSPRSQDCKGTRVRHLRPHHQKARNSETVVAVKMTNGHDTECFNAQFGFLEVDLAALSRVEQVKVSLVPNNQGGEKPVRHGHHAPRPKKYAVHVPSPLLKQTKTLLRRQSNPFGPSKLTSS
jgi:hypothetical protein